MSLIFETACLLVLGFAVCGMNGHNIGTIGTGDTIDTNDINGTNETAAKTNASSLMAAYITNARKAATNKMKTWVNQFVPDAISSPSFVEVETFYWIRRVTKEDHGLQLVLLPGTNYAYLTNSNTVTIERIERRICELAPDGKLESLCIDRTVLPIVVKRMLMVHRGSGRVRANIFSKLQWGNQRLDWRLSQCGEGTGKFSLRATIPDEIKEQWITEKRDSGIGLKYVAHSTTRSETCRSQEALRLLDQASTFSDFETLKKAIAKAVEQIALAREAQLGQSKLSEKLVKLVKDIVDKQCEEALGLLQQARTSTVIAKAVEAIALARKAQLGQSSIKVVEGLHLPGSFVTDRQNPVPADPVLETLVRVVGEIVDKQCEEALGSLQQARESPDFEKLNTAIAKVDWAIAVAREVPLDQSQNAEELMETRKKLLQEESCPICLDCLYDKEITTTKCGHAFCTECLNQWWNSPEKRTCPVCRMTD